MWRVAGRAAGGQSVMMIASVRRLQIACVMVSLLGSGLGGQTLAAARRSAVEGAERPAGRPSDRLLYGSYFGGKNADIYDIATDRAGNVYLLGTAYSDDFP